MTRKGAEMVIESLSMRVFEIDDTQQRLADEKQRLQARIKELEQVQDPIQPHHIISVG